MNAKRSKKNGVPASGDYSNEEEAYNAIFSGDFGSLEIGNYIGPSENQTEHLPDAIDFEDEDELADEELPEEEPRGQRDRNLEANENYLDMIHNESNLADETNDYENKNNTLFMDMEIHDGFLPEEQGVYEDFDHTHHQYEQDEQQKQRNREMEEKERKESLKYYFPKFQKGKVLRLTSVVPRQVADYQWQRELYLSAKQFKPMIPLNVKLEVQADTRKLLRVKDKSWQQMGKSQKRRKFGIVKVSFDELYPEEPKRQESKKEITEVSENFLLTTDDWDFNKIVGDSDDEMGKISAEIDVRSSLRSQLPFDPSKWNWTEDDFVEGKLDHVKAALDMNDEKLLLVKSAHPASADAGKENPLLPFNEKTLFQKFNISNDDKYKILKENYQTKIRSTISNLSIEHSQPATRLQSPFYKVAPSKYQMRHFHRPNFGSNIRPGTNIVFSRLKTRKRKKDKGKDIKQIFARSQDLTVSDSAPIFLMEYSEENPISLSKFGMGSKLINYYRKTDDKDVFRPKLPVGETHVLGVQDKSPFWNFGFVEPGNVVPTLYNNMVRAPVFKHDVSGIDFLLIRSSGNGMGNRFYLRNINHLFTVGQTFPVVEVPGPNSRKVTSLGKNRLRMIVYRILNKSPERRLLVKQVARHFPDQNDMQNRQRLKEFMKYQRDGDDHGFWKLKETEILPDNENVKKMIVPEDVALAESMFQGQQYQEDNETYNFDEKLRKLEENLIPWSVSKNFLNATQMRAMVQIHGAGDPTGCGEGFSFLKTSMKGGFTRSGPDSQPNEKLTGHSYNVAQQQKAYDEEISKTWYTQAKTLRVTNPFEEMDDPDITNKTHKRVKLFRDDHKVLRLTRKKRDENGIIQRQTVIIRDPRVIHGYLNAYEKKRMEAEANLGLEELMSDNIDLVAGENSEEKQLKRKKLLEEELARLQKSQERRQARKLAKEKTKDGKVTKNKHTNRRCATCGLVGHIRTNKTCPMYNGGIQNAGRTTPASAEQAPSVSPPET
ncbi:LAMI_0F15874g1_1 [Lachancea mirantina]|uniref:LAMI_0F15874g1_1 n=1 Tax=Lachancea mirantina TaxID=1230905 RepID=A0A1G4K4K7_9SACH|nr:LAMI_0F15874g1_1 [Lachancea mirantina]